MALRRIKTYTGGQGYVYEYYFVGKREAIGSPIPAIEYVFDVTSDKKTTYSVSIFLQVKALDMWAQTHGRTLFEAEQYGAVKMRLFQAFDEIEDMFHDGRKLWIDPVQLEQLLLNLGVT
jgi:hypothetical protein